MDLIITVVLMIVFTIVPVMVSARLMGARYPSFVRSALAVIAAFAGNIICFRLIPDPLIAQLVSLLVISALFAAILGAKLVQSFFIAVVAVIIQVVIGFVLAAAGIAVDTLLTRAQW